MGLLHRLFGRDDRASAGWLLGAGLAAPWAGLLAESDVWIAAPVDRAMRAMELHLLALHALCDAIDVQLLGEADAA